MNFAIVTLFITVGLFVTMCVGMAVGEQKIERER